MKLTFGIELLANEDAQTLTELIKFAEDNGLEYAWITDHYNNRDAFGLLTYIASRTDTIKLGPGVTNPYTRTAAQLASAIATVNEVSSGRAVFGIGPGDKVTFDSLGIEWEKPLTAVKETVEVVRAFTRGGKVSYDGDVCRIKGAKLSYGESDIPVYIGAQGPKMLALAGAIGDGVLVNGSHPRDFEYAVSVLKEGAKSEDRDFSMFDVGAYTSFSISSDMDAATKAARPVTAFIVAGSPDAVFEKHGIPLDNVEKVRTGFKKGFGDAVAAVTDEMLDAFSICGTPDKCIGRIEELIKAGVTQIITGSPLGPKKKDAIELIGKEIIPYFKEQ